MVHANFMLILFVVFVLCSTVHGNGCYKAIFTDDLTSCPGSKNEHVIMDYALGETAKGEPCLKGKMILKKALELGVQIAIRLYKITETGIELLYEIINSLCQILGDKNTPYYDFLKYLGTIVCPVAENEYYAKEVTITLDYAKDVMSQKYCGDYIAEVVMKNVMGIEFMCYKTGTAVHETDCEE